MTIFDFIEDENLKTQAQEAHDNAVKILKDDLENDYKGKLDTEVTGLKTKNEELLGEKKSMKAKLELFDGIDASAAREALELMEKNEDIKLIKDGKIDELIDQKTSQMRSDHEATVGELRSTLQEQTEKATKFEHLFNTKTVDDALREVAIKSGVRSAAVTDILLRGRDIFSVAEDGSVEARGKDGKLLKTADEKILTATNWVESLKTGSPHYWPDSEGAGAGSGRGGAGGSDIDSQMTAAAEAGNYDLYKSLKAKKAKMKA